MIRSLALALGSKQAPEGIVHPKNSVWALAEVIPANEVEDSTSFLLA
jgi:hypothetical protein